MLANSLIGYLSDNWTSSTPIHLAAYAMWRINWVHPFVNGNGRTARMYSYIILSIRIGFVLPGTYTIPHQISDNKSPYYEALDDADAAWLNKRLDLSVMENLLGHLLAGQLLQVCKDASGDE